MSIGGKGDVELLDIFAFVVLVFFFFFFLAPLPLAEVYCHRRHFFAT